MVEKKERSEILFKYVMVIRCTSKWGEDAVMHLAGKPSFDQFREGEVVKNHPCLRHNEWKSDHDSASVVFQIVNVGSKESMNYEARANADILFKATGIEAGKFKNKDYSNKKFYRRFAKV